MKKTLPIFLACMALFSSPIFAQWTSLGSGISATDRNIYGISVVDEQIIWGITSGSTSLSEFARTSNGGTDWISGLIDTDQAYKPTQIHAFNDQVAWVATTTFQSPAVGKIYKTTDGGENWTEQSTAFSGFNEAPMGIYFWDEQVGVAFGGGPFGNYDDQISIYTTDDGGDNWVKLEEPDVPGQVIGEEILPYSGNGFFTVVDDHIWFVTLSHKLYKSNDRGKTWTAQSTGIIHPYGWASAAFKDTLNGMVVNWDPDMGARTTDGGQSWELIEIPSSPEAAHIEYIPGTGGTYIIHDAFWDTDVSLPTYFAITEDNGDHWCFDTLINVNPVCLDFLSPTLGFAGGKVESATEGGFFKWTGDDIACTISNVLERSLTPLNISPNPTDQFLTVQLPENMAGQTFTLEVRDLNGRLLRQQTSPNTATVLDLGEFPSGIYLIEVFSREEVWGGKVVKE